MNTENLVENKFGTGAIPNKIDLRDTRWKRLASAVPEFDWSKGYDVEVELQKNLNQPNFRIPVKDQNGSFSCCGQAVAYYESVQDAFEKGVYTEKSARDAYSQIFYPGGGSSTRSAVELMIKKGVCKETLMSSYQGGNPPSEGFMEIRPDASQITILDADSSKGTAYASVKIDIDTIAQAIRDNKGLIFVVHGANNGTWLSRFPVPPKDGIEWAHCLYACKAKKINNKKYIGVINSWGNEAGEQGVQWLGEDYINKEFARDAMVIYDTQNDVLKQKIAWYEQILELLQKMFFGTKTKLVHN